MSGALAEAPTAPTADGSAADMVYLSPEQLVPWPGLNPRKHVREERIREIAASLREEGQLMNLVVHDTGEDVKWIVAGETRWRAAKRLASYGEPKPLLCSVREYNLARAFKIAMLENTQRGDLTVLEQARGYQRMIEEFGYTQEQIAAEILGDSRKQSQVAKRIGLLVLPESVLELVEMEVIPWSYAYDHLVAWTHEKAELQARLFPALVEAVRTTRDFGGPVARGWFVETVRKIYDAHRPAAAAADPAQIDLEHAAAAAAGISGLSGSLSEEVRAEAEHLLGTISATCDQLEAGDAGPRALQLDVEEFDAFATRTGLQVDEAANPTLARAQQILGRLQEVYRAGVAPQAETATEAPAAGLARCRECGCDDSRACEGGCTWVEVDYEKQTGLCSNPACVAADAAKKASALGAATSAAPLDLTPEQACHVREMAQQRAGGFDEYARRQFLDAVDDALEGRSRDAEEGSIYQRAQAWAGDVVAALENGGTFPTDDSGAPSAAPTVAAEPPAVETPQQQAARERLEAKPTPAAPAAVAAVATLPPPGAARGAVREGAGLVEVFVTVLGGRPGTIAILPGAAGVTLTVAPRITKAGETPFFLTAPTAAELDAQLIAALDTHFKS